MNNIMVVIGSSVLVIITCVLSMVGIPPIKDKKIKIEGVLIPFILILVDIVFSIYILTEHGGIQ